MSELTDMVRALLGLPSSAPPAGPSPLPPAPPAMGPAPPLSSYPSSEDAAYARRVGFGYGTPNEGYIQGQQARVLGSPAMNAKGTVIGFVPQSGVGRTLTDLLGAQGSDFRSRNLDLTDPKNASTAERMNDIYAKAALAANRIPIAALGFDPRRMVADPISMGPVNVAGAYDPKSDAIYFNKGRDPVSTPVHESIHRGLLSLEKDPSLAEHFKNLPPAGGYEHVVRYLMAKQAGDPEAQSGEAGLEQRRRALDMFDLKPSMIGSLDALTKAAQEKIKERNPRGPR